MKKLLLLFLIPFLSTPLLAEGFNDNYLQLGYTSSDYKHADKITNIKGSAEFGNYYSIWGDYFYETGDWNDPQEYETLTYDKLLIGVGKSFPLNSSTDITSSLSYEDWDQKQICKAKDHITYADGYDCTHSYTNGGVVKADFSHTSIGIRNLTASGFEISLKNTWSRLRGTGVTNSDYYTPSIGVRNISDSGLESSFKYSIDKSVPVKSSQIEFELIKHINKNFAIGGSIVSHKKADWTENGIFVRRSF